MEGFEKKVSSHLKKMAGIATQPEDRCEDWEKAESSRRSPASGNATEAQGHPRNSGARQSWTREFDSNPVRLYQRKGEAEVGAG